MCAEDGNEVPGLKFREDPPLYLRTIDRKIQNELGGSLDGETEIRRAALANQRVKARAMAKAKEMIRGEHFSEIICLIVEV